MICVSLVSPASFENVRAKVRLLTLDNLESRDQGPLDPGPRDPNWHALYV